MAESRANPLNLFKNPLEKGLFYLRKLTEAVKWVQVRRLAVSAQGRSIKLNSLDSIAARLRDVFISSIQAHGMSDKVLKIWFKETLKQAYLCV
jgi:hypothetical protein